MLLHLNDGKLPDRTLFVLEVMPSHEKVLMATPTMPKQKQQTPGTSEVAINSRR